MQFSCFPVLPGSAEAQGMEIQGTEMVQVTDGWGEL